MRKGGATLFLTAEHDAHLLPQLVDEDDHAVGLVDGAGELAEGLAHEPRLQAHVGVAHVALDLRLGHQGRHGVHHHHVDGAGADQGFGDLQGLLAGVRLGHVEIVHVDAQALGINRIESVLRVDEGRRAAHLLSLSHHMEGDGGLAGGLGSEDLDDPSPGDASHAQGDVEVDAARGDGGDVQIGGVVPQLHDGPLAELLFDLRKGYFKGFFLIQHSDTVLLVSFFYSTINRSVRTVFSSQKVL